MTEREHRNHPAVSRSELWRIHESPQKFKYFKDHPEEPTPTLLFGQVFHKLVLEPDTFGEEFAVCPDADRRTREGKQIYEGALASLKRLKDDVKEVAKGFECGMVFDGFGDLQEDDLIEGYIMVEVPR